jgi:hypothetical protein
MSLQTKFDTFRKAIEPTKEEIDNVNSSHVHLRQFVLQKKLSYVKNTIITGSYKRGTIIRPLNDVDIFVILNYQPNSYGTPSPQSIMDRLKNDLLNQYPDAIIKQDKPCVVLDFNTCKFELTPVIEGNTVGGHYYEIPNDTLKVWQKVDSPDVLGEKLKQANLKNPLLIPLIKMMKRCKQIHQLSQLRSFEMELLAIHKLGGVNLYREGVTKLLEIYGWLKPENLIKVKNMSEEDFGNYCRNTLFGKDFPA